MENKMLLEEGFVVFDQSLKVGIFTVDSQHKELIFLINELIKFRKLNKPIHTFVPLLESLLQYTEYHFFTEEKLIQICGYPNQTRHINKHREFTENVGKIIKLELTVLAPILDKFIAFLRKWVINHVKNEDKIFASYYLSHPDCENRLELELAGLEIERLQKLLKKFMPERDIIENSFSENEVNNIEFNAQDLTVIYGNINLNFLDHSKNKEQTLNEYKFFLEKLDEIVNKSNGYVDQCIGEDIVIIFDENVDISESITVALKLQKEFLSLNIKVNHEFGLIIGSGETFLGYFGAPGQKTMALLGNEINLVSHLDHMSHSLNVPIIITEHTLKKLPLNQFKYRYLTEVSDQKNEESICLYEIFDGDIPEIVQKKTSMGATYQQAIKLFKNKEFVKSFHLFKKCHDSLPDDQIIKAYLDKNKKYQSLKEHALPHNWQDILFDFGR
jgi:hemerythrin-like metal-binding protein